MYNISPSKCSCANAPLWRKFCAVRFLQNCANLIFHLLYCYCRRMKYYICALAQNLCSVWFVPQCRICTNSFKINPYLMMLFGWRIISVLLKVVAHMCCCSTNYVLHGFCRIAQISYSLLYNIVIAEGWNIIFTHLWKTSTAHDLRCSSAFVQMVLE